MDFLQTSRGAPPKFDNKKSPWGEPKDYRARIKQQPTTEGRTQNFVVPRPYFIGGGFLKRHRVTHTTVAAPAPGNLSDVSLRELVSDLSRTTNPATKTKNLGRSARAAVRGRAQRPRVTHARDRTASRSVRPKTKLNRGAIGQYCCIYNYGGFLSYGSVS